MFNFIKGILVGLLIYSIMAFFLAIALDPSMGNVKTLQLIVPVVKTNIWILGIWVLCGTIFTAIVSCIVDDEYCPFSSGLSLMFLGFLSCILGPLGFISIPLAYRASGPPG